MSRCLASFTVALSLADVAVSQTLERSTEAYQLYDDRRFIGENLFDAFSNALGGDRMQLYALVSASGSVTEESAEGDLFVATLSNLIYPTCTYGYFAAKADYASVANPESSNPWRVKVGAAASGIVTVFTKLFQFTDTNGDGEFTEGTDQVVDEISFYGKGTANQEWDRGEFDSARKTMAIKTRTSSNVDDAAFKVILKANAQVGKTPGGVSLTPANAKVDVEINYPNLQDGNFIGLKTIMLSTKASAKATAQWRKGFYTEQEGDKPPLGFAFDPVAEVTGPNARKIDVTASVVQNIDLSGLDLSNDDLAFLVRSVGLQSHIRADFKADASYAVTKTVFTFKTATAGKVIWDPALGVAVPEEDDEGLDEGLVNVDGAASLKGLTSMLLVLLSSVMAIRFE